MMCVCVCVCKRTAALKISSRLCSKCFFSYSVLLQQTQHAVLLNNDLFYILKSICLFFLNHQLSFVSLFLPASICWLVSFTFFQSQSLFLPCVYLGSQYRQKAQARERWCIIPSSQYATHPLRVKEKLQHFSLLKTKRGIGQADFHPFLSQVSLFSGCYPSDPRGCSSHLVAHSQTAADRNTYTGNRTQGRFYQQTDSHTTPRLTEKYSQSPVNIFHSSYLLRMISSSSPRRPNLQCIRDYLHAPIQRIPAREFQSAPPICN